MGLLRDLVERRLGLGVADEPRRVAVEQKRTRVERLLRSTPGARVRIVRDRRDGDVERALLWCLRRDLPVELAEGEPGVWLDGARTDAAGLRRALS